MALFRRSGRKAAGRIPGFWSWWADEGRAAAELTITGGGDRQAFATAMTRRVDALGSLDWELAAGETSEHVLVITAGGNPALRGTARRIVLAAPEGDPTWSYLDTRPPTPDPDQVVLGTDGAGGTGDEGSIDFARVSVSARLSGMRFDVQVHHPAFADLPPESRTQVTYLALDSALGEVDVELWIGEITASELPPLDGFGLTALRAVVGDHKARHSDPDGRPAWTLMRGDSPGGPIVASAQVPLHPLTAPLLDTYVAVVVPYAGRDDEGLPADGSLDALRDLEDSLGARMGADGAVVAHQSVAGVRTLHVYVDGSADLLPRIRALATTWPQGPVTVHDMRDPGWESVRHLRS